MLPRKFKIIELFVFSLLLILMNCSKGPKLYSVDCQEVIIDNTKYRYAQMDSIEIKDVSSNDVCLKIKLTFIGSCNTGKVRLIASKPKFSSSSKYMESSIKIVVLDKNGKCSTPMTKDFYFDISNLRVEGEDKVLLNFAEKTLSYLYIY